MTAGDEPDLSRTPIRCPFVNDLHPEHAARMQPRVVHERIRGANEQQVVEGSQIRWSCSACGYGELRLLEEPAPGPTPASDATPAWKPPTEPSEEELRADPEDPETWRRKDEP